MAGSSGWEFTAARPDRSLERPEDLSVAGNPGELPNQQLNGVDSPMFLQILAAFNSPPTSEHS